MKPHNILNKFSSVAVYPLGWFVNASLYSILISFGLGILTKHLPIHKNNI